MLYSDPFSITEKYEVEFLKLGDADSILIHYERNYMPFIILIDAGNIQDSEIIKNHIKRYYAFSKNDDSNKYTINLAICTHPDKDHKGGFFNLLQDNEIDIKEFWLYNPSNFTETKDIRGDKTSEDSKIIFSHPEDDDQNLIELIESKEITFPRICPNFSHQYIPIKVLGPTEDYYAEILKDMLGDYKIKTYEESDVSEYEENAEIDEIKGKIDSIDDDPSPYNKSSLILSFTPCGKKFLFTGDSTREMLTDVVNKYSEACNVDFLKVPHHGSHHNLNTYIIEKIAAKIAIICAAGNEKHPDSNIAYWLSRYGTVYSTHKCHRYIRFNDGVERDGMVPVEPLRKKINP